MATLRNTSFIVTSAQRPSRAAEPRPLVAPKKTPEVAVKALEEPSLGWTIIVRNDDVHTFDFVIDALCEICDHTVNQAEQCAWIIHFKGQCAVKNGTYDDLLPRKRALCQLGLDAILEQGGEG
ncbi:MAG: ATP-dependent Clp protease adaptor ClpS [Bacteroidota bacterium]